MQLVVEFVHFIAQREHLFADVVIVRHGAAERVVAERFAVGRRAPREILAAVDAVSGPQTQRAVT